MSEEMSWEVTRIKMWELGHSFEEIDALGVEQVGNIIGYWSGKAKGEAKLRKQQRRLSRGSDAKKKGR